MEPEVRILHSRLDDLGLMIYFVQGDNWQQWLSYEYVALHYPVTIANYLSRVSALPKPKKEKTNKEESPK